MLDGKRVLVVVPARGGSKGVPLKNIRPLAGKPLIAHTFDVVRELKYVDKAIVSTDHPGIANAARDCGIAVPFIRPPDLSGDFVADILVLMHALMEVERQDGVQYDVVVMLQPTCPLRKPWHVTTTVETLIKGEWSSVWTVSPANLRYHPLKQLRLSPTGRLDYFLSEGRYVIARQRLDQLYYRNGAAYAFTRNCIVFDQAIMGKRSGAVVIDDPLVNIDTLEDFAECERRLATG